MKKGFKGYFATGLLVVVPLYLSIYTLILIVGFMDGVFTILPSAMQPDLYLPFHLPVGIFFTLAWYSSWGHSPELHGQGPAEDS